MFIHSNLCATCNTYSCLTISKPHIHPQQPPSQVTVPGGVRFVEKPQILLAHPPLGVAVSNINLKIHLFKAEKSGNLTQSLQCSYHTFSIMNKLYSCPSERPPSHLQHFFILSNRCTALDPWFLSTALREHRAPLGPDPPQHRAQQPSALLLTRDCSEGRRCPFCSSQLGGFVGMAQASFHVS